MNRAQRRRLLKEADKMDKTISIKPHEIKERVRTEVDKAMQQRMDAIITESVANSLAVAINVLHDKYGFGKSRIQKFMNEYNELFDSILQEYVSFEDLKQVAMELGVGLEAKNDERD